MDKTNMINPSTRDSEQYIKSKSREYDNTPSEKKPFVEHMNEEQNNLNLNPTTNTSPFIS